MLAHALGPHLGVIGVGIDHDGPGEIFEGGGERRLQMDAHGIVGELLGPRDPVHVLLGDDAVLGLRDEVEGIDDVVGAEALAVMELDAGAQGEIEGLVVDPFPRRRQLALVLAGLGIAIDEIAPDVMSDDDALAHVVEIGVDALRHHVGGEDDGVVALAGLGGGRGEQRGECCRGEGEVQLAEHGGPPGSRALSRGAPLARLERLMTGTGVVNRFHSRGGRGKWPALARRRSPRARSPRSAPGAGADCG